MRLFALVLVATAAAAQSAPRAEFSHTQFSQTQFSHTTESLRGVSAVTRQIAWASGTHGTYLRTVDGGQTWTPAQVPGAASLDFRAVVAFDADEAFLMSAGPGDQSRIYHTTDAGKHWQLEFSNGNPKGFFDSMMFWDRTHGVVLGDPISDDRVPDDSIPDGPRKGKSGALKFELLLTDDGQTWHSIPPANLPPAREGEGAFAASNTCIAILPSPAVSSTNVRPMGWVTPTSAATPTSLVIPRSEATRNLLFAAATATATQPLPPPHAPHRRCNRAPGSVPRNRGRAALQRRVSPKNNQGLQPPTPTSGSPPEAASPASSILPIAAKPGRSSTLPSSTAPTPPEFSPSLSVTRCTE